MKTIAGLFLATLLTMTAGCAQKDWIDRTLVTVDVTGTWYGSIEGLSAGSAAAREMFLELKQEGSKVTGNVRMLPGAIPRSIEGDVAGDVFRFRQTIGSLEGEMTVSGDAMRGMASFYGGGPISLRRVDASSSPNSPPR